MNIFLLKDGREVILREAVKSDAQDLINFYNAVGGETDFLSFGKNEFMATVDFEEKYLENINNEVNSTLILAIINDKIIGAASINSSQKRKIKHVGTLGIVIKKAFCNMGLGKIFMHFLIEWAKSNSVTKKITLIMRADNIFAKKLYEQMGFETEGILKNENYETGKYYDCLSMGLILD